MRSPSFTKTTLVSAEYRVLVIRDSVFNGGNLTAHDELATTIQQNALALKLGRPVAVGNVSAGSWGPRS